MGVQLSMAKEPSKFNNVKVAIAKMKSLENRLKRLGTEYTEKYQMEIDDMKRRNIARKLTEEEMQLYDGPVSP